MEEGQPADTGIFYTPTPPHKGQCCVVLGAGNVRGGGGGRCNENA